MKSDHHGSHKAAPAPILTRITLRCLFTWTNKQTKSKTTPSYKKKVDDSKTAAHHLKSKGQRRISLLVDGKCELFRLGTCSCRIIHCTERSVFFLESDTILLGRGYIWLWSGFRVFNVKAWKDFTGSSSPVSSYMKTHLGEDSRLTPACQRRHCILNEFGKGGVRRGARRVWAPIHVKVAKIPVFQSFLPLFFP